MCQNHTPVENGPSSVHLQVAEDPPCQREVITNQCRAYPEKQKATDALQRLIINRWWLGLNSRNHKGVLLSSLMLLFNSPKKSTFHSITGSFRLADKNQVISNP